MHINEQLNENKTQIQTHLNQINQVETFMDGARTTQNDIKLSMQQQIAENELTLH